MNLSFLLRACVPCAFVLSLTGCMPAALPDCADPEIVQTARQISIDSLIREAASMPELPRLIRETLDIDVVDARTLSRSASGEEVRCAGSLWMRLREEDRSANWQGAIPEQRIPMTYRLSFSDRGEIWVEVHQ